MVFFRRWNLRMQAWKMLVNCLLVVLLPVIAIDIGGVGAAQKARKNTSKAESSAIVGEFDESDISSDNADDAVEDEKSRDLSKDKSQKLKANDKVKEKNNQNSTISKKKDKKEEEKLKKGFRQAEDFHKTWYHLPFDQVKASLEKLTKFCKVTCTKNQCMDEEVANNCHLMCPESTTKQCPDPLQQSGMEDLDMEEVSGNDMSAHDPADFVDDSSQTSASLEDSMAQMDQELRDDESEGG